jgi:hypothetical protein
LAAATAPRPADRRRNCQPRHARCQRSCLQNPTYIHSPFSASTSVPPALTSALFFLSAASSWQLGSHKRGRWAGAAGPSSPAGGRGGRYVQPDETAGGLAAARHPNRFFSEGGIWCFIGHI